MSRSDVVVHRKLKRMRPEAQRRDLFLAFVGDPPLDHGPGEYVAFQQEFIVILERGESLIKSARQRRHVCQLFGRKIIYVLVEWLSRIDAVLDAVEPGHQ